MVNGGLDPARWLPAEVGSYLRQVRVGPESGSADKAMIVGSTGPFAELAGRKALEGGGSATDAVVAASLAQIALAAGSWVSYAGVFAMVHYQTATGRVDTLSAGFATFAGETDPASIPRWPQPSGRTALVPGFIAGVHAVHQRFGRLGWAELFSPALYVAEHGFPVGPGQERQFALRGDVLARTPEGRGIFFGGQGRLPRREQTFRQPVLAQTLRRIAAEGPDWMYRGPWAREFVDVVGREGGRASVDDLACYQPVWAEPVSAGFHGHRVHALGLPDRVGGALAFTLSLAQEAGLGDPAEDPDSLYWLIQIARQVPPGGRGLGVPGPGDTGRLWKRMREAGRSVGAPRPDPGSHSDFVLAADPDGNVAAACHSINTGLWGSTGLFAGGVSIPDRVGGPQQALAGLAPGAHLPFPATPAIAVRDGQPSLACASIGMGGDAVTLQCLHAVLVLGTDIATAVGRPLFHGPDFMAGDAADTPAGSQAPPGGPAAQRLNGPGAGTRLMNAVRRAREAGTPAQDIWAVALADIPQLVDDRFDPGVLAAVKARGQRLTIRPAADPSAPPGHWGGIAISREPPCLAGARTPNLFGRVEGI